MTDPIQWDSSRKVLTDRAKKIRRAETGWRLFYASSAIVIFVLFAIAFLKRA